tara:strand:- start:233 stop:964 length:732 start_codon:yes stop_codon:yes gene_type:complete
MSKLNVLFYSNQCTFCVKILNLIEDVDSVENYKLISIDNNRSNFPYIQRVPTLIVKDLQKPLVGKNAFNWIKTKSQFNRLSNNINHTPNKYLNSSDNPLLYNKKLGPAGFNHNITKIDNKYAYIGNRNDNKNISYLKNREDKLYTLPEGKKINNTKQKKKLNALMNIRKQQDQILFNSNFVNSSSAHKELEKKREKYINSNISDINNRVNRINFSTPSQMNLNKVNNLNNMGIGTTRIITKKS